MGRIGQRLHVDPPTDEEILVRLTRTGALRRRRHISGMLAPLAVAGAMSFFSGPLSVPEAPTVPSPVSSVAPVTLPAAPGGATTNQFAGGRVPVPPQPV
jgi:hypothetical protein